MKPSTKAVLKTMQHDGKVSFLTNWGVNRLFDLRSRICELKKLGYKIVTTYKKDQHGKRYAEYSLGV